MVGNRVSQQTRTQKKKTRHKPEEQATNEQLRGRIAKQRMGTVDEAVRVLLPEGVSVVVWVAVKVALAEVERVGVGVAEAVELPVIDAVTEGVVVVEPLPVTVMVAVGDRLGVVVPVLVADGVALAVVLAVPLAVVVGDAVGLLVGVAEPDTVAVVLLVEGHGRGTSTTFHGFRAAANQPANCEPLLCPLFRSRMSCG